MCSVPADWSLPAEACEWLYLIMQLPSDRTAPASDGDCNLIRPIKKSFVKLDTLTEQRRTRRENKNNLPVSPIYCGSEADVRDVYSPQPPY